MKTVLRPVVSYGINMCDPSYDSKKKKSNSSAAPRTLTGAEGPHWGENVVFPSGSLSAGRSSTLGGARSPLPGRSALCAGDWGRETGSRGAQRGLRAAQPPPRPCRAPRPHGAAPPHRGSSRAPATQAGTLLPVAREERSRQGRQGKTGKGSREEVKVQIPDCTRILAYSIRGFYTGHISEAFPVSCLWPTTQYVKLF
ncbi:lactosylceramide 1,3-N-acetyl-beta-D-glucosaminyltransferase isoform X2 [Canis lupus dingo]|uniref:lactosylceramide 1,3-N-acetyl-beta-D-glucosaminyltransferase isoform X2 n=1 Tax=Canis lupus dingo TaxID=286419 RepID=UPI0020C3E6F1|nr:lactosylceramide 1,3-N-acetyl-beta-D-glucosaminyltransferase isoform X2 [Canis lupus dingo]